ncbi:MAG TPA: ribonuclease P protein component [Acidobacteriaceae bacterium]|nr:ribonuclease P protein component [Acidobacteriaceae bacterium]
MIAAASRLRKHADYQRVYSASRKQFSRQMSYFFTVRAPEVERSAANTQPANPAPRVGLTVGKVMGKAVDRNRIKRRMREAVRRNLALLTAPVDVILHPRRSVLALHFAELDREVAQVFRAIDKAARKPSSSKAEEATS